MKKIGIIGSGQVGQALAVGFTRHGYDVQIGSREGKKIEKWDDGKVGKFDAVAKWADIVVLCVKGEAAESTAKSLAAHLKGKTVIDATNPIDHTAKPENGVLKFFTDLDQSLMEKSQRAVPDAHFVKAFNSVGSMFMVDPDFDGIKPTMFICGNSESAKKDVTTILNKFGWEVADMGMATAARAIEPLCMLWCIPGLLRNDWSAHTFKMLKK